MIIKLYIYIYQENELLNIDLSCSNPEKIIFLESDDNNYQYNQKNDEKSFVHSALFLFWNTLLIYLTAKNGQV